MSNYRILLVWLGCLVLTASCSSGGKTGPVENTPTPQTEVTLQFFSDPGLQAAYTRGVQVLVYADNNQTIARTIDVDATGEASLGEFAEQLSLSLIYTNDSIGNTTSENGFREVEERRHIRSLLNYPLSELTLVDGQYYLQLSTQSSSLPTEREAPAARRISVTVQAEGADTFDASERDLLQITVQPSTAALSRIFGVTAFDGPTLSREDCVSNIDNGQRIFLDGEIQSTSVQDDGTVSFLSFLSVGPANPLQRYGFVLDQQVENNMDYALSTGFVASTINVNHSNYAINLPDNSSITTALSTNQLIGVRKGVSYSVSSYLQNTFDSNANPVLIQNTPACASTNAGGLNIRVADQFPVDHYVHQYVSTASNFPQGLEFINGEPPSFVTASTNFCAQLSASSTLPTNIELEPNQLDIASIDFDANQRTLEWQVSNDRQLRHTRVTLFPESEDPIFGLWTIDVVGNQGNETELPVIPAELSEEISESLNTVPQRIDARVFDYMPELNDSGQIRISNASSMTVGETQNQCTRSVRRLQVNIQDQ